MSIYQFAKNNGHMNSATLGKATEAPRANEPGAAAASAFAGHSAPTAVEDKAEEELTVAAIEAKIKGAKVALHDLSVKLVNDHTVKVHAVVEDHEAKADLILLVGNTPGVSTVQDDIKVRATGSDHEIAAPAPRFYQVKSGDTLSSIAEAELGEGSRSTEIFSANRHVLHDADQIEIGQTIKLPQE